VITVPERVYDVYVFDLDGTIYLGDELLPGAQRLIAELRERDRPIRFISNNPTREPQQYAEKLSQLGLPTPAHEIVNTTVATTRWLLDNAPQAIVFPIGEEPLTNALRAAGIRMSSRPEEIDIVISSYDRGFDYAKLQIAFDAIWFHKRATLIATNPDRFCPSPADGASPIARRSRRPSRRARRRPPRPSSASPTRRCFRLRWRVSTSPARIASWSATG
jgi:4-nitrophenyl phosphatase